MPTRQLCPEAPSMPTAAAAKVASDTGRPSSHAANRASAAR